ncbi:hypothetical protein VNI00_014598 [Paramarasmius palmivorus]|uniref:Uncharacterized protein n=1 Tax=Paramarasmius palmivorus TaxID=297713 RepID=A0AAW0BRE0_9AGAR
MGYSCLSSLITDAILTWRCFIIWRRRWSIVVVPLILNVIAYVWAMVNVFIFELSPRLALGNAVVPGILALGNMLLSFLIALRIFSIGRQVARSTGIFRKIYKIIIASTLESGIFYSAYLVSGTIIEGHTYRRYHSMSLYELGEKGVVAQYWWNVMPSISGITSIIIVVRVALGIALNAENEVMSIRVAETTRNDVSPPGTVLIIARDQEAVESDQPGGSF